MSRISNNETAILGLLYEHHHYAYRLKEIMEKRGMHNWSDVEFSEDTLEDLQKGNLIKSRDGENKVYYITEEGKKALMDRVKELLSKKDRVNYPIDMGFANIDVLSRDETIRSLKILLKSIEERIEYLNNAIRIQRESNVPYNFIAIFTHSNALLKAERDWIEGFIQELRK